MKTLSGVNAQGRELLSLPASPPSLTCHGRPAGGTWACVIVSSAMCFYIQFHMCARKLHAAAAQALRPWTRCPGPVQCPCWCGSLRPAPIHPRSGSVDPIVSCVTTRRPANKGRLAPSLNIAANLKPTIRADSFTSAQWGDKDGALGGIEGRKKFTLACRVPRERDRTQLRRSRSCGKLPIWFRLINMIPLRTGGCLLFIDYLWRGF